LEEKAWQVAFRLGPMGGFPLSEESSFIGRTSFKAALPPQEALLGSNQAKGQQRKPTDEGKYQASLTGSTRAVLTVFCAHDCPAFRSGFARFLAVMVSSRSLFYSPKRKSRFGCH